MDWTMMCSWNKDFDELIRELASSGGFPSMIKRGEVLRLLFASFLILVIDLSYCCVVQKKI